MMIIQATGIEKSFGSLKVLKGVDFAVSSGEVVSINYYDADANVVTENPPSCRCWER